MKHARVARVAGIAGSVIALAALIFAVAALSSPKGGSGGLPFIKYLTGASSSGEVPLVTTSKPSTKTAGVSSVATSVVGPPLTTRSQSVTPSGSKAPGVVLDTAGKPGTTNRNAPSASEKALSAMLPESVAGYDTNGIELSPFEAIMALEPGTAAGSASMSRALLTVHDRGSATTAGVFVAKVSRVLYSADAASVTVGSHKAYFGTDGRQLASVSFPTGRYVIEVIVTSRGGSPAQLKDAAIRLASAFRVD